VQSCPVEYSIPFTGLFIDVAHLGTKVWRTSKLPATVCQMNRVK
jgi:hypothetical protein